MATVSPARAESVPTGRRLLDRFMVGSGAGGHPARRREEKPSAAGLDRALLRDVRVLIVDDAPDVRELLAFVLSECGAAVVVASSADEAVERLETDAPGVLVSDISMPGRDGYWLIDHVRRHPKHGGMPALAITAFGREHGANRALAAGFHGYLQKPIEPDDLCRAIARLIGR